MEEEISLQDIEESKNELALGYEKAYELDDITFFEPLIILKPINDGRPNWWHDSAKVHTLIEAFKSDFTVSEACVKAKISQDQYKYFCRVHPQFLTVKARCKEYAVIIAKQGLMADLADPEQSRTRQWFLEKRQPQTYGRDIGAYTPPPAQAATRITGEAFLDKDGKVIVSTQTAEMLKKEYGDNPDDTTNSN